MWGKDISTWAACLDTTDYNENKLAGKKLILHGQTLFCAGRYRL